MSWPGHDRVGHVRGDGGEAVAELGAELGEPGRVAGDPDDAGARLGQRGGDAAAEAPARPGDDGCRSC